jgi:hypothetical protein
LMLNMAMVRMSHDRCRRYDCWGNCSP